MHYLATLLQIVVVYLFALISPGPNFFMVTQLSLAGRRGLGVASAAGVGVGSTLWAALAMLGFAAVLQHIGWLYNGVRVAGALYLVWFGLKLLRSGVRRELAAAAQAAVAPPPAADRRAWVRTWRSGLVTCLTNPKSCVFWTSVFAAVFPAHPPLWFYGVALATVAAFAIVTAVFTTAGLVFKAFFRIEFLFTLGEDEFVVAVPTDESFVFVHVPIYLA